ncbi:MAG: hypothetical protein ABDH18_02735 [Aquificaceae bacterium]
MLFSHLSWQVIKLGSFISFALCAVFFVLQVAKLDFLLISLPIKESFMFFLSWFFYHYVYFLPVCLTLAYAFLLFELKKSSKLKILASFYQSETTIYLKTLTFIMPLLILIAISGILFTSRDLSYIRKRLSMEHYSKIITSVPSGTFRTADEFTIYIGSKNANTMQEVFFDFSEGTVLARSARLIGDEILFERGSILLRREGSVYSVEFERYRLNLGTVAKIKRKDPMPERIIALLNSLSAPLMMALSHFLVHKSQEIQRLYYLLGPMVLTHQLFLILLRRIIS